MNLQNAHIPIIGFAAYSGTGKTTLVLQTIPRLQAAGLRVGVIKHAHHQFEVDQPGKDSYEIRKAGATQTLITSRTRWALMVERDLGREPLLDEALLEVDQMGLDLVVVEGFKREHFPKIEVHRPSLGRPLLSPRDPDIVAIAADAPVEANVPVLDLNQPDEVVNFILTSVMRSPIPAQRSRNQ